MVKIEAGQVFGGKWCITSAEPLGEGGNSYVYPVLGPDGEEGAIKFLKDPKPQNEKYKRFRDEVTILRKLGKRPGILPLLDANLPHDGGNSKEPPYSVTPIAVPIREKLKSPADIEEVVRAVAEIAGTLVDISAEVSSHRDIKPENLFWHEGQYVLGDFGLVDFPGKAEITTDERRVGPLAYLPDEMIDHPDTADGSLADVHCLAKTLYVLAVGDVWPPQGPQRAVDKDMALSSTFPIWQ